MEGRLMKVESSPPDLGALEARIASIENGLLEKATVLTAKRELAASNLDVRVQRLETAMRDNVEEVSTLLDTLRMMTSATEEAMFGPEPVLQNDNQVQEHDARHEDIDKDFSYSSPAASCAANDQARPRRI